VRFAGFVVAESWPGDGSAEIKFRQLAFAAEEDTQAVSGVAAFNASKTSFGAQITLFTNELLSFTKVGSELVKDY
jgi:hypothetical protein